MKKTEICLVALCFAAAGLTKLCVAGSPELCVLAFLLLSLFYLLFGTFLLNDFSFRDIFRKAAYAGVGAGRLIWSAIIGIMLNIATLGLLFGCLLWQEHRAMMFSTLFVLIFYGSITFVFLLIKPLKYKRNILLRCILFFLAWVALKVANHDMTIL